jgi:(R)-2-hydroxyacyl-CoA dehydratese activating ATPase
MTWTVGIDVGSTYTKAVVIGPDGKMAGRDMTPTGFRLEAASDQALASALEQAGVSRESVDYIASTGYGRNQISYRNLQVTDLTAQAWGTRYFYPETRTVLDIGGQTMKAMRLDGNGRVATFRLNDKCAAGTGAFLEKTARYLGYRIEEIGPLVQYANQAAPISGVCAVFAESEVINHVSNGEHAGDIMYGAMESLIERSVRLMKRVQMEPEFTLVGGIMRFATMARVMKDELGENVNVLEDDLAQYSCAIGAAVLAGRRLQKLQEEDQVPESVA